MILGLISIFARLNIALAAIGICIIFWSDAPQNIDPAGLGMLLSIQLFICAAIYYTTEQKKLGTDIGHKTFPASIVAYLLWLLISLRWYSELGLT